MGERSIAVAVLVAAALSVATAGAASAGEPEDDRRPLIVTCENGELVTREPTEEDRERLRAVPARPERPRVEEGRRHRVEPGEGAVRVLPDGEAIRVVPAEPGAPPPVTCDADGPPSPPRVDRVEPAVPAPPR
ncbi:hypothetical protein FHX44_11725 [Pseudonocardia hierapolitana]|uniref:Secreted protein n=1 Tax=Pseudonocardia hierapolitana TaxID=1128676 RepID=A0A561SIZ6_9PSEU|nr:hypothetical protein [Pseudonocardia hierapolitana]TWF74843.1 hypothetical protein FHX44_11725 [Pseudonocardia hierapolitana]